MEHTFSCLVKEPEGRDKCIANLEPLNWSRSSCCCCRSESRKFLFVSLFVGCSQHLICSERRFGVNNKKGKHVSTLFKEHSVKKQWGTTMILLVLKYCLYVCFEACEVCAGLYYRYTLLCSSVSAENGTGNTL